jgi:hypothetical protein
MMVCSRYALVLALCAGIVMIACSKKEESAATTTIATSTVSTATVQSTSAAPPPATTSPAATAGSIASTEGETPGLRVDVTELKRASGGTVNLKFVLVNGTDKAFGITGHYLGDSHVSNDGYRGVSGVHLIDPINKKKYFVVADTEKNCLCSKDVPDVPAGGKVNLWAKFPAPPPEVQKLTIEIPHFAPIDDVQIQ